MWTEKRELGDLSRKNAGLYSKVEDYFSPSFFPMLVADGLAQRLPNELANNPLLVEYDTGIFVIHVGSVKLALYRGLAKGDENLFSIQLISMEGRNCTGMSFYTTPNGLQVEYTFVTPHHGPERFTMMLPDTKQHPLNQQLMRLYPLVAKAMSYVVVTPEMLEEISLVLK